MANHKAVTAPSAPIGLAGLQVPTITTYRSFVVAARAATGQWCAVVVVACVIGFCYSPIQAIRQETRSKTQEKLTLGEPITSQITGSESQTFAITLASAQYAQLEIQQHGSILLATLVDPLGNEVIQMDSPAGGHGPIYISAIASRSGTYQLQVQSTNKWSTSHSYDVSLKVLRNEQAGDNAVIRAEKIFAEGRKHFRADRPEDALKSYDLALAEWKALGNQRWQAVTEYARSEAYRNLDRKKSEEALNETLKILDLEMAPNDWRLKASALNDLGPVYGAVGKNEQAFAVLDKALALFRSHHDMRGQASALGNLARLHGRAGDLSISRELIEKALALRRAENDRPGEINLLNNLGALSDQLGEPDEALGYLQQALRGWEAMDEIRPSDHARVAAVLSNLGSISDKLGDWDKARQYYDRALAKYNPSDPNRAVALDNKGDLYFALGDYHKARECYDEALAALGPAARPDKDLKAGVLVHKGQLSIAEGNLNDALSLFVQARSQHPNLPRMADVLTNLGAAFAALGRLEEAMKAYESALEIQIKLGDRRGQALTLQKRGEAYDSVGQQTEALNNFNRALVFWKQIKDRRGEAITLNSIARVEQKRGNLASALNSSDEAVRIVETQRTKISNRQLRTSYFSGRQNFYELDIDLRMQLSKSGKHLEDIAKAFESSEKARARILIDTLGEATSSRYEYSQTDNPRLLSLRDQRKSLLAQVEAKVRARTKLLSGNSNAQQVAVIDKEIDQITERVDELEARLKDENPRFATLIQPQPSSLSEIQRQLDQDTLLVEYSLGDQRSYVWVVTTDSIKGLELPARKQIEAAANRLVNALTSRTRDKENENPQQRQLRITKEEADYPGAAAALSKMVIGPIASALDRKRLVVVSDGALQFVPFSALVIPNTGQTTQSQTPAGRTSRLRAKSTNLPLISRYEIVTLPSASVLAVQRREIGNRKPAPLSVAILADPVFDPDDERVAKARTSGAGDGGVARKAVTPPSNVQKSPGQTPDGSDSLTAALRSIGLKNISWLPFSREEAEAIKKVVPQDQRFTALDFDASRATAASPSLAKYKILHIATHGVMDLEHPELSGVILSMVDAQGKPVDGYLRLHEIYNLNLPAELVVLSACQTGVGKQVRGEGLIALTRGFMYAGAKSVVASYWKVNDKATAELMAEFYKQMFVNKQKPAAALRQAQIKLSQSRRWNQPQHWAGFFLQGEWN